MLAGSDPSRNCGSIRLRSSCRLRIRSTSGCTTSVTDGSSVTILDLPRHARFWQMRFTSTHTCTERRWATHYAVLQPAQKQMRSEEHTSELQSLMRSSYAVFCLKKKTNPQYITL